MRRSTLLAVAVVAFGAVYIRVHPLVFNESFLAAHCIRRSGLALTVYAQGHGGTLPAHAKGYGDAPLLMAKRGPVYRLLFFCGGFFVLTILDLASKCPLQRPLCGRLYA
jgi:hypothetical protein